MGPICFSNRGALTLLDVGEEVSESVTVLVENLIVDQGIVLQDIVDIFVPTAGEIHQKHIVLVTL